MFAFDLGGCVFTEMEGLGLYDCWAHCTTVIAITHLQSKIPSPTIKNAINKIVVPPRDQQFTYNLPKSTDFFLFNCQFVFRLTPLANGFGGGPESDFLLTLSNGLSSYVYIMNANQLSTNRATTLLEPFSIH